MSKFPAGRNFPMMEWPQAGGGMFSVADRHGWRMLVVYRGRHCGLCKKYLANLDAVLNDFDAAGVTVAAVSADTREKAEAWVRELGLRFPVAYDLSVDQMRTLGLYVSPPEHGKTDRPFAEPGVYVVNPDGRTQVVNVSNAPFARPELHVLLEGIKTAMRENAPIHGVLGAG